MFFRLVVVIGYAIFALVDSFEKIEMFTCQLPKNLKKEIQNYQGFVDQVIYDATRGKYSGRYYNHLEDFIDTFGNRFDGTSNLETSIDSLATKARESGLQCELDPVQIPDWVRGNETAYLVNPRKHKMKILGLGYSAGTGPNGITADVLVVKNFNELQERAKDVKDKIVLFDVDFTTYGQTAEYRVLGPMKASKLGAVAALVKSVTTFSIYSPHTGMTKFEPGVKEIPAASVTLEDSDLMARLFKKGQRLTVYLKMDATLRNKKTSRNLLIDIKGSTLPNHYVTMSGHIDSWDVGQGALDDGVGAFLGFHSLLLLKSLKAPKPKRTIRAILWTGEEMGLLGAKEYLRKRRDELAYWTAAMESDYGSYNPLGLNFDGSDDAFCILKEITSLFKNLNATNVRRTTGVGSDISVFKDLGVPLVEPQPVENNYMWFHHTEGDSMETLNSEVMDKNLALFTGVSYILANLSIQLPRAKQSMYELLKCP